MKRSTQRPKRCSCDCRRCCDVAMARGSWALTLRYCFIRTAPAAAVLQMVIVAQHVTPLLGPS